MSRENIKYLFREGRSINFYERMADFVRKSCKIQHFTLRWITILDTQYFDSFFFLLLSFNECSVNEFSVFLNLASTWVMIWRQNFQCLNVVKYNFEAIWERIKFLITKCSTKFINKRNSTWKENLGVDLSERDFLSTKELLHA